MVEVPVTPAEITSPLTPAELDRRGARVLSLLLSIDSRSVWRVGVSHQPAYLLHEVQNVARLKSCEILQLTRTDSSVSEFYF